MNRATLPIAEPILTEQTLIDTVQILKSLSTMEELPPEVEEDTILGALAAVNTVLKRLVAENDELSLETFYPTAILVLMCLGYQHEELVQDRFENIVQNLLEDILAEIEIEKGVDIAAFNNDDLVMIQPGMEL